MRLAIDASNLIMGGGVTHLVELLRAADPAAYGIEKIIVWARAATLARIEDRPWLEKRTDPALEGNYLRRAVWQCWQLGKLARAAGADLMFVPGGSMVSPLRPAVTMSRNMLPFEWRELKRFGLSATGLKLLLLRWTQSASLKQADGTIFLTRYAYQAITRITGTLKGSTSIIPHGVDERFCREPRLQRSLDELSEADPLRIIYVSTVDVYKHQWSVVEAVGRLRREGLFVRLDLYGPDSGRAMPRLVAAIDKTDSAGDFIRYWGPIDYDELDTRYSAADLCVFASSCENMPNILVESMAAALPIACSELGPMPEILGDAGIYFDPQNPDSIADAIRTLAVSPELRSQKAAAAAAAARQFSWSRCAHETLGFLADIASQNRKTGST
jgi:glycosyltransferase involved in cell wall biosynthesis